MIASLEMDRVSVELAGRPVLAEISLCMARGEVLGVLGPNGAGKTTLLRAALGLARLGAGEARLEGRDVRTLSESARANLAGYLPQDRRVGWNLPAWRIAALGAATRPPRDARRVAMDALDQVGMAALAQRGVLDMSGGERARVLLARLIATAAPLLIADEPAAGLDPDAQFMVMEVLAARAAAGAGVMVTLHDLTLAVRTCDRIAVLSGGRLVAIGRPEKALEPMTLREAFGLEGEVITTPLGPVIAARRRRH
ncbi:MAG TPA: ABC transporter ATP-binding protein [Caulobacteraceae bacterium]